MTASQARCSMPPSWFTIPNWSFVRDDHPIDQGNIIELRSRPSRVGRSSVTVEVELGGEGLLTGERRRAAVS